MSKYFVLKTFSSELKNAFAKTVEQIKIKMNRKKSFLFIKKPHVK